MPLNNPAYNYSGQQGYSNVDAPYSNHAFSSSTWLEKEQARNRRSKWLLIGGLVGLIALIAIGVGVGVGVAKSHSSSSSSKKSSGSSASVVNQTDPNDPSTFQLDSRLKKSFYGIAYTPEGSQLPDCGNSLEDVITDIQLLSQLTDQIRLYGADCNQTALVLEAIKQTKVNMTVWLGNYPVPTDPAPYERQRDAIIDALKTYGTDHVSGITVGNEFILNYLNANGATDPNSAVGNAGAQLLIANISDTRSAVQALGLSKTLPIGTADAGSFFNSEVLAAVDYGMSNIHAWFANVSIDQAAGWVDEFFQENNVALAQTLANSPKMYIAETGWPTASKDVGNESNGPSVASEPNLQQTFLDTFVCQANNNGTGYFFFEYFDETWKDQEFGGVEGHWGLFYSNRTLKDITIPSC
ncbi:glycoside hydrolase [Dichomitus squalens]|uniref:glucan endo-1,3-beta-D-glucosidase n=1 Tax=Dichomitus squalens TaxID=114155 RepID=A0A4Q9Q5Y2_9APHY|nr:glycoside hydrolase [Dichomitus squalens]TBU62847.1 glycoside hydrolase [Dichomitus squalens]